MPIAGQNAPLFAAKVPVGMLSGYLLSTYVPENGHKDPKTLWLIIGLVTMTSPICITLLEKYIREPSKADTVGRAQNSFNPLHVPFVIRGDDDDDDDECEEDKETGLEPESKVAHVVDGLFDDNYDASLGHHSFGPLSLLLKQLHPVGWHRIGRGAA